MTFSNSVLSILAIIATALAVVALGLWMIRALRDRRSHAAQLPHDERLDVVVQTQQRAIARLEETVRKLAATDRQLGDTVERAVQHVGVVRFDAFEDMGGRLSFSAALLDARGDGVVITSINGRQDTRCYAKQVEHGTSMHNLSDEEEQAIRDALNTVPQTTVEAR